VLSDWTNDVFSLVKNDRTGKIRSFSTTKILARNLSQFEVKMAARFTGGDSVDNFISEQENKATSQKTERDVKLLHLFLETKNKESKMEDIPTAELNEYVSEFIISVRTKDGKEYE
jgi:hypothetical protein